MNLQVRVSVLGGKPESITAEGNWTVMTGSRHCRLHSKCSIALQEPSICRNWTCRTGGGRRVDSSASLGERTGCKGQCRNSETHKPGIHNSVRFLNIRAWEKFAFTIITIKVLDINLKHLFLPFRSTAYGLPRNTHGRPGLADRSQPPLILQMPLHTSEHHAVDDVAECDDQQHDGNNSAHIVQVAAHHEDLSET